MLKKRPRHDPRDKRIVGKLRQASSLSDWIISTGMFGAVAQWALEYPKYLGRFDVFTMDFGAADVAKASLAFAGDKWAGILLALALYSWFWGYRHNTNREMDILDGLYPSGQAPTNWDQITNRRYVRLLAVGIVAAFMIMAALLDAPHFFAMAMICLWCQDLFGNEILRENLRRILVEHPVTPSPDVALNNLHANRRKAAERYWLGRGQIKRIVVMMICTVLVLFLSLSPITHPAGALGLVPSPHAVHVVAQLLLAAIILGNEATMVVWRRDRDALLLDAEIEFADAKEAAAAVDSPWQDRDEAPTPETAPAAAAAESSPDAPPEQPPAKPE